MILQTERLVLRPFQDGDREPFAAMNADPRVMRWFQRPLQRAESDAFVDRIEERRTRDGYSLWAVQVAEGAPFIGFVGLWNAPADVPFAPGVEVGWRLAAEAWGNGYATEAAECAVDDGFTRVGLEEIVSFTSAGNLASRAVMERLGMHESPHEAFWHPNVEPGHALGPHVLYRYPDLAARRDEALRRQASDGDVE